MGSTDLIDLALVLVPSCPAVAVALGLESRTGWMQMAAPAAASSAAADDRDAGADPRCTPAFLTSSQYYSFRAGAVLLEEERMEVW
ncbi:hypothetical protein B0T22DRAFT_454506 [Podospora appendiculata]|uniref:Uncharacterized protein n=1 Tax=Podospora appendiculata TaxID=314037 RepID=A0AAE1CIC0_9PEZI|nr:hypothetical protein B0T22DRAFT_454506 [Podospora appendiculata]